MKLNQNDWESIKDRVQRSELTIEQSHVEQVKCRRVLLCTSRVPADVRKALNTAVKAGTLGHMKKDGHKPEAYFHPTFEYLAKAERNEHVADVARALAAVCGTNPAMRA